ncbi:MAG TPA: protein kinase [Thermoanaerobaculia bacterium]|nr:protein kinase [Thermoanaerobaculia bacterium]
MPFPHPSRLGRYDVQAELGRGSMGVVYLARDPLIGRLVALKVFHPSVASDPDERDRFRSRFLREAQSAGILSHPNIVTIHDVVDDAVEERSFIAMEYVQGTNLKDVLRHGSGLDLVQVVDVVRQVAAALDYAHARGVVHRDVKPANVLLTPERQVKITDFGIARFESSNMTLDGQLLGTPNYMSPEQVQGREVDHRSDLFSLGVVLYEMITRHKPFAADSLTAVTHRIVYEDFTPLTEYIGELPPGLDQLFRRALAKDPARRYPRAGELAGDFEQAVRTYTREVALSETQSLPRSALAGGAAAGPFPPDDDADTLPGTLDGPRTLPPSRARAGLAALRRRWATGWPARQGAAARRRLAPVLAGAGGLLERIAPEDRPPGRRLALVAALTLAVALAVGVPALLLSSPDAEPVEYSPEYRRQVEYLELLREGYRLLAAGEPTNALMSFRQAEVLVPNRPRAGELAELAVQAAREQQSSSQREAQVALQLMAAQSALEGQRYEEAVVTAEAVLEVEPEHEAAAAVVEQARRALARRAAAARRAEREQTVAEPAPQEVPASAEERGATQPDEEMGPISPARLVIVAVAEGGGQVRVRDGQRELATFEYDHSERAGLLRRRRPVTGTTRAPDIVSLAPGAHTLDVWVTPLNERAIHHRLTGTFRPGATHTLRIVEHPSGEVTARLE